MTTGPATPVLLTSGGTTGLTRRVTYRMNSLPSIVNVSSSPSFSVAGVGAGNFSTAGGAVAVGVCAGDGVAAGAVSGVTMFE